MKILQKFSIDSWKAAFLSFLEDMQKKYKGHIFKRTNNYSGVSKQDGMFSAFEEVTIYITYMYNSSSGTLYSSIGVLYWLCHALDNFGSSSLLPTPCIWLRKCVPTSEKPPGIEIQAQRQFLCVGLTYNYVRLTLENKFL